MSRPIGKRIREACEVVERLGPCGVSTIGPQMDGVKNINASHYLNRAVGHGLLVVDKSHRPYRYSVADGWRDMLPELKRSIVNRAIPRRAEPQPAPHPLAAVWARA